MKNKFSRTNYDTPWKNILDKYFCHFMEYCYPQAALEIDWSKGYESLDKELTKITHDVKSKNRVVDKLMKVYRKNGEESWVLIHCEIQGKKEPDFAERMFIYRYRLFDKYRKPVASFAVLTDDNKDWRPDCYEESLWGSYTKMQFAVIKLLDYRERQFQLTHSANPFSTVIEAHLAAIESRREGIESRLQRKISLTRRLYEKGWKKEDIIHLYRFVDWVLVLPKKLALEYHQVVREIEGEKQVEYITTAERIGIEQGIEQGVQQGVKQGIQQTNYAVLKKIIEKKYPHGVPDKINSRLDNAASEELKVWLEEMIDTQFVTVDP